ncbi:MULTISPECIES: hypothetical protein [unclassified Methanoregula]|uniref:hypothetical protein n=1 Tax=unclassified Methanoregula TaxID=2649730 RepID=UPI0009C809E9|nr:MULTISPECIES: hypothetical protein [unclassified Methanoregula]OPX65340.1 MAG: hypothetical protein A4E33_00373 [Methanoregula sp. PtaB.Bin085]OPY32249.1 MAG: hypothetical protein A4E34_02623 [Methanoregula sp. PtaU1.Bin006]
MAELGRAIGRGIVLWHWGRFVENFRQDPIDPVQVSGRVVVTTGILDTAKQFQQVGIYDTHLFFQPGSGFEETLRLLLILQDLMACRIKKNLSGPVSRTSSR